MKTVSIKTLDPGKPEDLAEIHRLEREGKLVNDDGRQAFEKIEKTVFTDVFQPKPK